MDDLNVLLCANYENVTEYVILPTILFGKSCLKAKRGRISAREYSACRAAAMLLVGNVTTNATEPLVRRLLIALPNHEFSLRLFSSKQ
jgi:hypothetical protein